METSVVSRRERKKQETKAGILKAARHLFEEKGFENTSIEEITERADLSKGTFFNYFSGKEGVLTGIAEEEAEDILFLAEDLDAGDSVMNRIRQILKRLLADAVPYLHLTGRVVFSSIINTGEAPSPFYRINGLLEDLIGEGQAKGELTRRFSPEDMATAILGGYYGVLFKWFGRGGRPGTVAELDCILDILLQGITEQGGV